MDADELRRAVEAGEEPAELSLALRALCAAARGDWDAAHGLAQDDDGADAAWVHAHLHRAEGDESNASYWYRSAGRQRARGSIEEEWHEIAAELLRD